MQSAKYQIRLDPFTMKKNEVSEAFREGKPVQNGYSKYFVKHIQKNLKRQCRINYAHPGSKFCSIILCCSNKNCKKSYKFKAFTNALKSGDDVVFELMTNEEICEGNI